MKPSPVCFNPLFWGQCLHLYRDREITSICLVSIPSSGGSAFTHIGHLPHGRDPDVSIPSSGGSAFTVGLAICYVGVGVSIPSSGGSAFTGVQDVLPVLVELVSIPSSGGSAFT